VVRLGHVAPPPALSRSSAAECAPSYSTAISASSAQLLAAKHRGDLQFRSRFSVTPSRVFFFFQAEDGIRDRNVTGVQTCALPISIDTYHHPLPYSSRMHTQNHPEALLGHL